MATTFEHMTGYPTTLPYPQLSSAFLDVWVRGRLTAVFEAADEIPFDDDTRIIFFSDCHRGDNSRADEFAPNEALFLNVLSRYYDEGFSYIEVGDGDELWKNRRFQDIRRAHGRVFDLLHRFDEQNRLHLILGNHDIQGSQRHQISKDGLTAVEGLILKHTRTAQRLFVLHGHQADPKSDWLYQISRFVVRRIWRQLQLLGLGGTPSEKELEKPRTRYEYRLLSWAQEYNQPVICGHTHHPTSAQRSDVPYFNTGCCLVPGVLTGLELRGGELSLVRWRERPGKGAGFACERDLLAPPRQISQLN